MGTIWRASSTDSRLGGRVRAIYQRSRMHRSRLDGIIGNFDELRGLCLGFFMVFSRFEFSLKEKSF